MQRIINVFKKNNLVLGILLLVLITALVYKAYVLRVESKIRKTALDIVTVHASYNEFLRENRLSSDLLSNEIKYSDLKLYNNSEVLDANNTGDLSKFWNEFFFTIRTPDFSEKFELQEGKLSEFFSMDNYGKNLNLIFWANDRNKAPYKLTLGILIKGQHGVRLDQLIDDGSPLSGHMKLQRVIDKSKTSDQNNKCVTTSSKKVASEDFVDCNYVYLF